MNYTVSIALKIIPVGVRRLGEFSTPQLSNAETERPQHV